MDKGSLSIERDNLMLYYEDIIKSGMNRDDSFTVKY